jgi:hypothetical protein
MTFKILTEEGKITGQSSDQLQEKVRSSTNEPTNQPKSHQWSKSPATMN